MYSPPGAGCFSWHVELWRVWERQLLELMSVLLPEPPGQAGCSPGTPSPQSITFSACPFCRCGRRENCATDGNWRLASLSRWFSASGRLPRLEPQHWVCGVLGSDAWFLFWAVHTLEEWREALTHADLMFLDVTAFVLLWYPYAKSLHGFLWKLPGCWEKSRAACVHSSKHATQYL